MMSSTVPGIQWGQRDGPLRSGLRFDFSEFPVLIISSLTRPGIGRPGPAAFVPWTLEDTPDSSAGEQSPSAFWKGRTWAQCSRTCPLTPSVLQRTAVGDTPEEPPPGHVTPSETQALSICFKHHPLQEVQPDPPANESRTCPHPQERSVPGQVLLRSGGSSRPGGTSGLLPPLPQPWAWYPTGAWDLPGQWAELAASCLLYHPSRSAHPTGLTRWLPLSTPSTWEVTES